MLNPEPNSLKQPDLSVGTTFVAFLSVLNPEPNSLKRSGLHPDADPYGLSVLNPEPNSLKRHDVPDD